MRLTFEMRSQNASPPVLMKCGFVPVSTSFYRDNPGTGPPPYRSVPLPRISER